ncbi:hypothetical protein NXF25_004834 [Crotalus adamanteus]|uniref:Uncharacterized protein n=1 Tax=Crotalus adamanteus TaxID=8729 RepID=A0AAW1BVL9_CROAD
MTQPVYKELRPNW